VKTTESWQALPHNRGNAKNCSSPNYSDWIDYYLARQTFFGKGQIGNILCFAGLMVSVTTIHPVILKQKQPLTRCNVNNWQLYFHKTLFMGIEIKFYVIFTCQKYYSSSGFFSTIYKYRKNSWFIYRSKTGWI
jgi:hypothetical protein